MVADALTFHAFEIDGVEKHGDDSVLDVKVTPNRGHDCLSHRGIAKELSAILKLPLNTKYDPLATKPALEPKTDALSITIENPQLTKRAINALIRGIQVGPSPDWLKQSIESIGQRSINNIVDITNLVMFNIGQPMHAFDAAGFQQKDGKYQVGVRTARDGEKMTALDGKEYTLESSMLVIADNIADVPVDVAGVKGGKPSGITTETKDIILEAANFDGVSIRKTSQKLKLRTDASARFEQGLSPELPAYAMRQAVDLVLALAGGELVGFVDQYPEPQQQVYVPVPVERVNKLLGTNLTAADVADAFTRLGFAYKETDGVFEVQPPFERLDITIAEDLIEEVARIVGYDKIPATPLPVVDANPAINKNFYAAEKARLEWTAKGYSEVFTSVFADKGERVVLNKVDGVRPYLRNSLIPGLTDALIKNKPNKDLLGLKEIKLFEIGPVWKAGREVLMLGTVSEKEQAIEMELVGPENPERYDDLPLSTAERYQAFSKYPYIVRDVALWVPTGTTEQQVQQTIKAGAGELAQKISLFDTFEKDGRTSLAFRIIFQSFDRTLTEVEVNEVMAKISHILVDKGFEIR
jgi:phenylalanyl-tRNA synthetase beta chain